MAVKKTSRTTGQAAARTAKTSTAVRAAGPAKSSNAAPRQGYNGLAGLGEANFNAFVQSNTAFAKGCEVISQEILSFAQKVVQENASQAQALIGARSLQEALELQNAFAQKCLEDTLSETAKLTELSAQVASEAIEPIQKRVDATVETVLKSQAA